MNKILSIAISFIASINIAVAAVPTWSVNPSSFTYGMTVTALANVDCEALENPSNLIAAFVGGDCRGVAQTSNVINSNYVAFLTVYSNSTSGETVSFKVYDASTDTEYDGATTILFQDGASYGFPTTPYEVSTNERPTDIALSSETVDENDNNAVVGTLSSTDPDAGTVFTYALVAGDGDDANSSFSIAGAVLSVNGTMDYESADAFSIRIQTDDGSCAFEEAFTINVNDLNDDPTDINLSFNQVSENVGSGTVIGSFSTVDQDATESHSYEIVAGAGDDDNDMFAVTTGGELKVSGTFDFEDEDTLYVRVETQDGSNATYEESFMILLEDENDAPSDIAVSKTTFAENRIIGASVLTFTTTDQDAVESHSYSFNSDQVSNNDQFTIVGANLRTNANFDYESNTFYTIRINSMDVAGASYTKQFVLQVTDSNDTPSALELSGATAYEAAATGTLVGTFSTEDQDAADTYTYSAVAGAGDDDNASFTISADSLYTNAAFDFNAKSTYTIRVQTADQDGATTADEFEVSILNSNDTPTDLDVSFNHVSENETVGTVIGIISTTDKDVDDDHVYTIVTGAGDDNNSTFGLTPEGDLKVSGTIDFETEDTLYVRVQTRDLAGATFQKSLMILVDDENDSPTDIAVSKTTFAENRNVGSSVLSFSTTDPDAVDSHNYSFNGDQVSNNDLFTIVGATLRTNSAFDFEDNTFFTIRVNATDVAGASITEQFVLQVTDSNDVPSDLELSNASTNENASIGTFIGKFSTEDQDAADTYTYSVVSGTGDDDNASFSISNDSLYTGITFDFNTKNQYSIRVQTADQDGASLVESFDLFIKNSNDAPTDMALSSTTVDENLAIGSTVGEMSSTDADAGDGHTYALVNGTGDTDNALFSIDGDNLNTHAAFDFETTSTYSVRLQATDQSGLQYEEAFTITINDANDAPTDITMSTDSVDENIALNTAILTLSSVDQDAADSYAYAFDDTQAGNDNQSFVIVGDQIKANSAINYESKSVYFIYVTTNDGKGGIYTRQLVVQVRDQNDGPTDMALSANKVVENGANGLLIGRFTTTDQDAADSFNYALASGTGGQDNAGFAISGDSLLSNTSYDYETDNYFSIRVRVTDGGGSTYDEVYSVRATDVNDAPTALEIANDVVAENAIKGTVVGGFTTTDVDSADAFNYSLVAGTGDTDNASFKIQNNQLVTNAVFNFEAKSSYDVRIKTTDKGGATFEAAFVIAVSDQNDVPTDILMDTDTVSENTAFNTAVIALSTTDQDVADTYSYSFDDSQSGNDNANFVLVGNSIKVNAAIDFEAKQTYFIYVTTNDNAGGTYTRQLVLNIRDENDGPTDLSLSVNTVDENVNGNVFIGTFSTTDQDDGDDFSYSLIAGNGGAGNGSFQISNDSLYAVGPLDFESKGTYSILVESEDQAGETIQDQYTIVVNDLNDAPTGLASSESEVNENSVKGTAVAEFSTADVDAGDSHTYSLVSGTGNDDNSKFKIVAGQLVTNSVFDFESKDTLSILVRTTDTGGLTFDQVFEYYVLDTNDEPTDILVDTDTISENVALNTPVVELSSVDQDTEDIYSYTFDDEQPGNDNGIFIIVGNQLLVNKVLDFEQRSVYFVYLTTTDQGGLSHSRQLVFQVKDENDAPTALDLEGVSVAENGSVGDFVGVLSTTDQDAGDSFTYALISGAGDANNSDFNIVGDSLFAVAVFDFEQQSTYSIRVTSTDVAGASIKNTYQISIENANDVPTAISVTNLEIEENNTVGATIGWLSTTDEDVADVHIYTLVSGTGDQDNGLFGFDGANLVLNRSANFEEQEQYSIRVQSSDQNGGFVDSSYVVAVIDENEAPVIVDTTFTVSENADLSTLIGEVAFSDVDDNDNHSFELIDNSNFITLDNWLVLRTDLDYNKEQLHVLQMIVEDNGGLTDTAEVLIIVQDEIEVDDPLPVNKMMSPNGDGKNDHFQVESVAIYDNYSLKIFNNMGLVIYRVDGGYDNSWSGKYNGKLVEPGVYYYLFENNDDSADYFKGSISIIR